MDDIRMIDNTREEKLIAACWAMYSAIRQARAGDIYDEKLIALYEIAEDAMMRYGQIAGGENDG